MYNKCINFFISVLQFKILQDNLNTPIAGRYKVNLKGVAIL